MSSHWKTIPAQDDLGIRFLLTLCLINKHGIVVGTISFFPFVRRSRTLREIANKTRPLDQMSTEWRGAETAPGDPRPADHRRRLSSLIALLSWHFFGQNPPLPGNPLLASLPWHSRGYSIAPVSFMHVSQKFGFLVPVVSRNH
jgi:hypothetical protein